MGTTLTNGVYLPNEGERNCYAGLKTNWEILDQKVADVTALQQAVAGALHREIVESLPTTDIDPNTIYMILSGTSATENVYNEFMYVNNAWELIGTSATDLANYYTKAEVDGKLLLKANDSDVVHKSGNEIIGGIKTFSNDIRISKASSFCNVFSSGYIKGQAPSSNIYSGVRFFDDINSGSVNTITGGFEVEYNRDGYNKSYIASRNYAGETNKVFTVGLRVPNDDIRSIDFLPSVSNIVNLGISTNKWKSFNGVEPSSLSLPSGRNTRVDISSYFTNLGSGDTNSYSVSANGYIYMQLKDIATVHCFDFESLSTTVADYIQTFSRGNDGQLYVLFPVKKDHVFKSTWYTNTTVTISGAYFIPCLGNV